MEFVVNEWLPNWLSPLATQEEFKKANLFLYKFYQKQDILCVKYNSPFREKLMQFSKQFSGYDDNSSKLSFVINKILLNSEKCRLIYDEEILVLPDAINLLLHQPFDSDKYLFESAFCSADKIVITTDIRLIEQTSANGIIEVVSFDDFIANY